MSTAPHATRRHSGDALRRTIYLWSTFADLAKPRAAVAKAVERLQGHTVVGMERYLASDQRPVDRCLSDVAMCDYYLGLFAWRYGYVQPRRQRSQLPAAASIGLDQHLRRHAQLLV